MNRSVMTSPQLLHSVEIADTGPVHPAVAPPGETGVPFGVVAGGGNGRPLLPRLPQPPETEEGGSTCKKGKKID
jgi:hypothetical protein